MRDLPVMEIEGLLRAVTVRRVHEVAMPLDPPGARSRLYATSTTSGEVALRWKGQQEVALWNPRSDRTETFDLHVAGTGWQGVAVHGERLAVADASSLRLMSRRGDLLGRLEFEDATGAACCSFSPDGTLWLLHGLPGGRARLSVLDGSGDVIDAEEVAHEAAGDPSYWLEAHHPALTMIPISAGMGQDGAFYQFARTRGALIALDEPVDDICFAGWSPSGAAFATLPHYGALLRVCSLDGELRWQRHLEPLLDEIDDGHNWQVCFIDDDHVVLPTSEGRLLVIARDRTDALELRLLGDERNWDWAHVQLGPDTTLVTARLYDAMLGVWDLSDVVS